MSSPTTISTSSTRKKGGCLDNLNCTIAALGHYVPVGITGNAVPGWAGRQRQQGGVAVLCESPAGLFAATVSPEGRVDETFQLGPICAPSPTGTPAARWQVELSPLSFSNWQGVQPYEALPEAKRVLVQHRGSLKKPAALDSAERLASSEVDPHRAIVKLGEGWVAEEALAISVYCALVAEDFRHGVILAVNHDGDSDSTGSITETCSVSVTALRRYRRRGLQNWKLRNIIEEIADDLCDFTDWPIDGFGDEDGLVDRIWHKYPGF